MNINFSNLFKYLVMAIFIGGVVIVLGKVTGPGDKTDSVKISVPTLSVAAQEGQKLFEANCMECHGKNTTGTKQGLSFINSIYRPNHHGDQAFVLAALRGVRAHHWPFGNMPAQPQVNEIQVLKIVTYVRELQRENGIN